MAPDEAAGILEEREVPSESEPGKTYRMVRTVGGWQHWHADCDGYMDNRRPGCRHTKELDAMTAEHDDEPTTALAIADDVKALAALAQSNERAVIARLSGGNPEVTKRWVYEFRQGGQDIRGISKNGVEEAVRHLASTGEVVRVEWVRMDYEDENEARFMACAARYAVTPDGTQSAELDRQIRGKRIEKMMKLRDGSTKPDPHWWEKGITKAARNAAEALLPELLVQTMLNEAGRTGGVTRASNGAERGRQAQHRTTDAPPRDVEQRRPPSAQVMPLLNECRQTWDAEAFASVWQGLQEQYPAAFGKDGGFVPSKLKPDEAMAIVAQLKRELHGEPPTDDGAQQGELT